MTCSIDDCDRPSVARGMCKSHWGKWHRYTNTNRPICNIEGCSAFVLARGWCDAHYARWEKHGNPLGGGLYRGARATNSPILGATDGEVAWLAGLLEGEGTFVVDARWPSTPRVKLVMTDKDVVVKASKLMTADDRTFTPHVPSNPKWNASYSVGVSGKQARQVMTEILPYMCERRTAKIMDLLENTD